MDDKKLEEDNKMLREKLEQIKNYNAALIDSAKFGRATVPALSKLFYGLKGIEKSVASNTSNAVTTEGIRGTVGSIAQPVEDAAVGLLKGDAAALTKAGTDLVVNIKNLTEDALGGLVKVSGNVIEDTKNILIENYGKNSETKSTSDVNMKLDVNVNGGTNMTKEEIHNIVLEMFKDTKVKSELMNGSNYAPVATVGAKNQ